MYFMIKMTKYNNLNLWFKFKFKFKNSYVKEKNNTDNKKLNSD